MEWLETEITRVVQETPMDRSFTLRLPDDDGFTFEPGQFLVTKDPQVEGSHQRAYSISSAPGTDIEVTVRDMGEFGHRFYDYPVGKPLLIRRPQGRFVLRATPEDDLIMVSGGSGITPFRSFVRHLRVQPPPRRATLLQSAQQAAELIYRKEFERHARECPWLDYRPTVTRATAGDTWRGLRGRIGEAWLREVILEPLRTRFYVCGPGAFVKAMLALAETIGVPKDRRHKEQWG
jgi:ferredoxin-NADP reductase